MPRFDGHREVRPFFLWDTLFCPEYTPPFGKASPNAARLFTAVGHYGKDPLPKDFRYDLTNSGFVEKRGHSDESLILKSVYVKLWGQDYKHLDIIEAGTHLTPVVGEHAWVDLPLFLSPMPTEDASDEEKRSWWEAHSPLCRSYKMPLEKPLYVPARQSFHLNVSFDPLALDAVAAACAWPGGRGLFFRVWLAGNFVRDVQ